MAQKLMQEGLSFELHYCTRTRDRSAFLKRLEPLIAAGQAFLHCDNGDPREGLDLAQLLRVRGEGAHLYYCGPPGFMRSVAAAASHWPPGATHREYFTPPADPTVPADDEGALGAPFKVRLARTGLTLDIPADKTILNVLREHDVEVETACELGVCGTCRTRYLEGEPDHRDFVLEEHEHKHEMTVCCSRSKSPLLILDL